MTKIGVLFLILSGIGFTMQAGWMAIEGLAGHLTLTTDLPWAADLVGWCWLSSFALGALMLWVSGWVDNQACATCAKEITP